MSMSTRPLLLEQLTKMLANMPEFAPQKPVVVTASLFEQLKREVPTIRAGVPSPFGVTVVVKEGT